MRGYLEDQFLKRLTLFFLVEHQRSGPHRSSPCHLSWGLLFFASRACQRLTYKGVFLDGKEEKNDFFPLKPKRTPGVAVPALNRVESHGDGAHLHPAAVRRRSACHGDHARLHQGPQLLRLSKSHVWLGKAVVFVCSAPDWTGQIANPSPKLSICLLLPKMVFPKTKMVFPTSPTKMVCPKKYVSAGTEEVSLRGPEDDNCLCF